MNLRDKLTSWKSVLVVVVLLLTALIAVLVYPSFLQVRALKELDAAGARIYFANYFDVDGNQIRTWNYLDELLFPEEAYKQVDAIDLRDAEYVSSRTLSLLAKLDGLRDINLSGTDVTNSDLAELLEAQPRIISLRDTMIDDTAIDVLSQMKTLVGLDLAGTMVTDSGIERLNGELPNCDIRDFRDSWPRRVGDLQEKVR